MKYYLGINIDKTDEDLRLYAETYIHQALARYGLQDIHPVKTPIDPNIKLAENPETYSPAFKTEFQSKLGTLVYPSNCARPDITFATNYFVRYGKNLGQTHMDAVIRIFAYLKATPERGIKYHSGGDPEFKLYSDSDSDHAGCTNTRRSTTGWNLTFMGGAISWRSYRQATVAHATCDAKYVAASEAIQEAIWVKGFVNCLSIRDFQIASIPLFIDNEAALALTKTPRFHTRSKHIDVKYHFTRDNVGAGHIITQRVKTNENVTDILTKAMTRVKHEDMVKKLGMEDDDNRKNGGWSIGESYREESQSILI